MRGRSLSCAWYTSTLKRVGYCPTLFFIHLVAGTSITFLNEMKFIKQVAVLLLVVFYFYYIKSYMLGVHEWIQAWQPFLMWSIGFFVLLLVFMAVSILPYILVVVTTIGDEFGRLNMLKSTKDGMYFCTMILFTAKPNQMHWYIPMAAAAYLLGKIHDNIRDSMIDSHVSTIINK